MDKYNVSVLAEAKEEYTKQLINILYPHMYVGVKSIYDFAKSACLKSNDKNILKKFQLLLSTIPDWNQTKIDDEYKRIESESKCDWIDELITAVFVSHTKVLTSIRMSKKSKTIELDVPQGPHFIHKCYIETARNFWKKPYLLHTDFAPIEIQRNLTDSETLIKNSVEEAIRKLLPVRHILKEYLGKDYKDDDGDITSNVSITTKNNLRKLVKQEIEQSLAKSNDSNDKIENYSRVNIASEDSNENLEEEDKKQDEVEEENNDINVEDLADNVEPKDNKSQDGGDQVSSEGQKDSIVQEDKQSEEKENIVENNDNDEEVILEVVDKENESLGDTDKKSEEDADKKVIQLTEKNTSKEKPEQLSITKEDTSTTPPSNDDIEKNEPVDNKDESIINLDDNESISKIIDRETDNLDTEDNEKIVSDKLSNDTINSIRSEIKQDIDKNRESEDNEFSFFEDAAPF